MSCKGNTGIIRLLPGLDQQLPPATFSGIAQTIFIAMSQSRADQSCAVPRLLPSREQRGAASGAIFRETLVISEPTACSQAELLVRFGHSLAPVTPRASELESQQCCEKVHWPMHDDHAGEAPRPKIDELKGHDQWKKLQETKED